MRTVTVHPKLFIFVTILLLSFGIALGYLIITLPERGRDTQRVSDLKKIEDALNLYFLKYGKYPCGDTVLSRPDGEHMVDYSIDAPFLDGESSDSTVSLCTGAPRHGLYRSGIYATNMTQDPLNERGFYYGYQVESDRQSYLFFARLEYSTDSMKNDGGVCANYFEQGPSIGTAPLLRDLFPPCN